MTDTWAWNIVTLLLLVLLIVCCCVSDLMQDSIVQADEGQVGVSMTADETDDVVIELETRVTIGSNEEAEQQPSISCGL